MAKLDCHDNMSQLPHDQATSQCAPGFSTHLFVFGFLCRDKAMKLHTYVDIHRHWTGQHHMSTCLQSAKVLFNEALAEVWAPWPVFVSSSQNLSPPHCHDNVSQQRCVICVQVHTARALHHMNTRKHQATSQCAPGFSTQQ